MTAANNECLLWNPKEQIKTQAKVEETSQPDKIIDFGSSDNISHLALQEIDSNIFMASVSSDTFTNVYFTKSQGKEGN